MTYFLDHTLLQKSTTQLTHLSSSSPVCHLWSGSPWSSHIHPYPHTFPGNMGICESSDLEILYIYIRILKKGKKKLKERMASMCINCLFHIYECINIFCLNQHTRELISARNMSHTRNSKNHVAYGNSRLACV